MKKEVLLLAIFILSISFATAQLADSPWPTFHGDAQRSGLSPYNTSHVDGTVLWTFQTGGEIHSSPSIGPDGTIYVGSHDGYMYAVNKNGTQKWKIKIGTPIPDEIYGGQRSILSTPSIAADRTIYIVSMDQFLFAISPDGIEKWKFEIGVSFDTWAAPVIETDGTIYITSSRPKAGLYAVNPDGTEKWYFSVETNMFNSPTIGKDGIIYVGLPEFSSVNKLFAVYPNGTKKWETTTSLFLESTPAIGPDGTIYIGSFSEEDSGAGVYAFSPDGTEKWHFTTSSKEIMSTPAIGADGTIYVASYDGYMFYAINPDGTEKWNFPIGGTSSSSPAISAEGTIYFGVSVLTGYSGFIALNPDGTEKWHSEVSSNFPSSPAIGADGTIYVGSWDNNLYAFGGEKIEEVESEEVQEELKDVSEDLQEESKNERNLFQKIADWFKNLFS